MTQKMINYQLFIADLRPIVNKLNELLRAYHIEDMDDFILLKGNVEGSIVAHINYQSFPDCESSLPIPELI